MIIVCFAGCAQKNTSADPATSNSRESKWIKTDPTKVANASKAKTPPINATTYFTAGLLLEKEGNLAAAADKFNQALELKPDHLAACNHLGQIYLKFQQYDKAESLYQKTLKHQPKNTALLNNLAFVYLTQHRYAEAEAELNQALKLDPDFKRAHVNLGLALAKQGKYDEALTHFRRGCPEFEANYNLAIILHTEGKLELARKYYQTSLRFNPNFEPAKKGLEQLAATPTTSPATQPTTASVTED
jgi:superkiller protein 3